MEEMYESLSMLLAGDLDPAREKVVRERIATDTEWRAAWEAMQSLPGALRSLAVQAPPPAVDERVASSWAPSPAPMRAGPTNMATQPRPPGRHMPTWAVAIVSAAAGAFGATLLLEGRTLLLDAGEDPRTLQVGDNPSIGVPATAQRRVGTDPEEASSNSEAERELADLRVKYALVKGQLDAIHGAAIDFPPDLPPVFLPAGFASSASFIASAVPGTELLSTECDEYPCIAYYRTAAPSEGWHDALNAAVESTYGPSAGVFQFGVRLEDDGRAYGVAAVAVTPTDDGDGAADVRTRVTSRVQPTLSEIESDIKEEANPR